MACSLKVSKIVFRLCVQSKTYKSVCVFSRCTTERKSCYNSINVYTVAYTTLFGYFTTLSESPILFVMEKCYETFLLRLHKFNNLVIYIYISLGMRLTI